MDVSQLLLDWELGDMTGIDVLRTLKTRGSRHLSRLRIIILSGSEHADALTELWSLGVDSYWLKPLSADRCKSLVEEFAETAETAAVASSSSRAGNAGPNARASANVQCDPHDPHVPA